MIITNIKMAITSIMGNKLRSTLTMLGIVIGIAAVIAMLSMGKGAQKKVSASIEKMGTNILSIRAGAARQGTVKSESTVSLTLDDAIKIKQKISVPVLVAPEASGRAQVKYLNSNANTTLLGVNIDYFPALNYEIDIGRFFTDQEDNRSDKVCVIGKTIVSNLFPNESIIVGKKIRINQVAFSVIGVYKEKGDSGFRDADDQIMIPIKTLQKRFLGNDQVKNISVSVINKEDTNKAKEEIIVLLRQRHKLTGDKPDDFQIRSQLELVESLNSVTKAFTLLLGSIAFISLLVGGIGIMNILLVSVTERTKEIGIRKAIGAYEEDILNQFLVESIILCIVGGIIGIGLGVLAAKVISLISKWPFIVPMYSIVLAFTVSMATGVFFGYYPARKAAKMNPVDALRYE